MKPNYWKQPPKKQQPDPEYGSDPRYRKHPPSPVMGSDQDDETHVRPPKSVM